MQWILVSVALKKLKLSAGVYARILYISPAECSQQAGSEYLSRDEEKRNASREVWSKTLIKQ